MRNDASPFEYGPAFDTVDIGIIVLDEDRRIAAWNEWIARASGHSKEAVLGKKFAEIFPETANSRLASVIDDCFEFESSSVLAHSLNTLLPLRSEAGHELVHNMVVRPMSAAGAKYCLLQVNDVTVAVARERLLRERQNARYRAIVDTAPDAIITTTDDGAIQWLNGEAEHVFGYASGELLGKKIDELLVPGTAISDVLAEAAMERPASVQVAGRNKNGEESRFEVSFSRWVADDRVFVTTIWRDVTDLLEAQTALRRSNEVLEARVAERTHEREVALSQLHESQKMESLGQLTGGLAHDFNNLLAVILGNLALLKKNIPTDPRNVRWLDGAIQGAERGATLTKRLLAFARRQELKLEAVEIQRLVPDMLDFLRQSVGPSITVATHIHPDVHPVCIDANQLELALMNLVLNARDAMPGGGAITIASDNETSNEAILGRGLPPGEYVRLSVSDTGEGMDEATLAKAVEPFFTTKGVGKGTGLGLPMVHGLTAQSGGAMQISSEAGKGTVVTLWLPRSKANVETFVSENVVQLPQRSADRKLRVLVVDDDMLVRMGTADMLTDLGHEVVEASGASQALEKLQGGAFEVVITDYAMPGTNGLELATKITQMNPEIAVILATGYAELPTSAAPLPYARLTKPFTQDNLAETLQFATTAKPLKMQYS